MFPITGGACIPLRSLFNWEYLEQSISGYHDQKLFDYIKFGFPLGLNHLPDIKVNAETNHSSATLHPQAVDQYIEVELNHGALLGPFRDPPHPTFTWSPLMTRPKGDGRRVILDLSYGSNSVNKNTHTGLYDNTLFTLKLPNLESLLPQSEHLDQDARLYKVDISRAFRNVRMDPGDAVHLGIYWNNHYFLDKNLAFGAIHGTAIFQRITDFVRYLMAKHSFSVHNYIDDIYAVAHRDLADVAFETLKEILHGIGLPLNENKVFAPCTSMTIMGIVVDIQACTFSIPHDELLEIVNLVWRCSFMIVSQSRNYNLFWVAYSMSRVVSLVHGVSLIAFLTFCTRTMHNVISFPTRVSKRTCYDSFIFFNRLMAWSHSNVYLYRNTSSLMLH